VPSLVKLYQEFQDSEFTVLAIDINESKQTVKNYARKAGMSFPVLLDPRGRVARVYGVRGTPAHFLIDKKGDIAAFASGAKNWEKEKSRNLVQFLLTEKVE
jgi:peroxiredoxin